jgi:hypothetical protein
LPGPQRPAYTLRHPAYYRRPRSPPPAYPALPTYAEAQQEVALDPRPAYRREPRLRVHASFSEDYVIHHADDAAIQHIDRIRRLLSLRTARPQQFHNALFDLVNALHAIPANDHLTFRITVTYRGRTIGYEDRLRL